MSDLLQKDLLALFSRDSIAKEFTSQPDFSKALGMITSGEMREGQQLQDQLNTLEALVTKDIRPIISVVQGHIEQAPSSWQSKIQTTLLETVCRSVGRIDAGGLCVGSGFVVSPGVVMTTRKVAELFALGVGRKDLEIQLHLAPTINFAADSTPGSQIFRIEKVELIHPFLDVALLRLPTTAINLPDPLTSAVAQKQSGAVAVVGHAPRSNFKYVSPGEIIEPVLYESHGNRMWAISHDCTAPAASTGGPLIDLTTGYVIGIHANGGSWRNNWAVPLREILRDVRVAPLVKTDAPPETSERAWREQWQLADSEELPPTSSASSRSPATPRVRETYRARLRNLFGTASGFTEFLEKNGYGEVLNAVPQGDVADPQYLDSLIKALARRGKLDQQFESLLKPLEKTTASAAPEVLAEPALAEPAAPAPASLTTAKKGSKKVPVAAARPTPPPATDLPALSVEFLRKGAASIGSVVLVELGGTEKSLITGWLLTPRHVVVPMHALSADLSPTERMTVRFDFDTAESQGVRVDVAKIASKLPPLDIAFLELAQPAVDREPLKVSTEDYTGTVVAIVHQPQGGPKRFSLGSFVARKGDELRYSLTTEPGSGGSPVFNGEFDVVGMHRGREPDGPRFGVAIASVLKALRESEGVSSRLWREIVAAQPNLRSIDTALYSRLPQFQTGTEDALVPMIVEVLDGSVVLENVPDLKIRSRGEQIFTVLGSRRSLDALARHAGVLSVQSSGTLAQAECSTSVPYVGATQLHLLSHKGNNALIGVIDNGVDIFHSCFLDDQGQTRIIAFWDQKDGGANPTQAMSPAAQSLVTSLGLTDGTLYLRADIQQMVSAVATGGARPAAFPDARDMQHGTTVCSIAAGRNTGATNKHFPGGVAPEAQLVVVRYDLQGQSIGSADSHISALRFIDAIAGQRPVVVNISNGMNQGAHDGTSSVESECERFMDNGKKPGRVIVKSAGNEGRRGRHALINAAPGTIDELRWRTQPKLNAVGRTVQEIVELWYSGGNRYEFRVKPPGGSWSPPIVDRFDEFLRNGNRLIATVSPLSHANADSSFQILLQPGRAATVEAGDWTLSINVLEIARSTEIHAWIEEVLNRDQYFLDYIRDDVTVTIPGTAEHVITVGAIEAGVAMRAFEYGSRGPTRTGKEKPNLVAPGVGIFAAKSDSADGIDPPLEGRSGTSFAAPHVAGTIALVFSERERLGKVPLNALVIWRALELKLRHRNPSWNERTGYGELDAQAFFNYAVSLP